MLPNLISVESYMMKGVLKPHNRAKTILNTGRDYCSNTSVHGFSYLNGAESMPHRIFWDIFVDCLSLIKLLKISSLNYHTYFAHVVELT